MIKDSVGSISSFLMNHCFEYTVKNRYYIYIFIFYTDTRHKALLALGSMSKFSREQDPALSSDIVLYLHHLLEKHALDTNTAFQSSHDYITLLNSIGNTGDNSSRDTLHKHAKGEAGLTELNIQHAAIRGLREHHDKDVCIIVYIYIYIYIIIYIHGLHYNVYSVQ